MAAPRYRRVGPASGQPQRLVITKDVSGCVAVPMMGLAFDVNPKLI